MDNWDDLASGADDAHLQLLPQPGGGARAISLRRAVRKDLRAAAVAITGCDLRTPTPAPKSSYRPLKTIIYLLTNSSFILFDYI